MAAKVHQLAKLSGDPKIHNFLKDPSGLYAHFLRDTTDPKPSQLSPEWGRTKKHSSLASLPPKELLTGLLISLVSRKGKGEGKEH